MTFEATPEAERERKEWRSWSGSVRCRPREQVSPASEGDLLALLERAAHDGLCVRPRGTGHSGTPLVTTDDVLVSLDRWTGIEFHSPPEGIATVRAGTVLHDLGQALLAQGAAMQNLGDVDVQTLGGALGTGTHGTGRALANLSSQVVGLRLATADAKLCEVRADSDADLLRAARVSIGVLGIVTAATLRVLPAYRLHESIERASPDECLAQLDERVAGSRHFEFFWYPGRDVAELKTLRETDRPPDPLLDRKYERIGWSADIISSVREERFFEMEYAVPAEHGPACFREVRDRIRTRHPDVRWPVEYRTVAADDAWLSPAFGRDTVTISVHQDGRLPYEAFFADVEPIFHAYEGRPHWGKIHRCDAAILRPLYPRWDDFLQVRERLDPEGRFLTPALRTLLGV